MNWTDEYAADKKLNNPVEDDDQFTDEDRWAQALDIEERKQKIRDRRRHKVRKKKGLKVKIIKICLTLFFSMLALFVVGTFAVSGSMYLSGKSRILTQEEWAEREKMRTQANAQIKEGEEPEPDIDCIFVLGCSVMANQTPSDALRDRLDQVVDLYHLSPHKIVVSGDHSEDGYYNEVRVMKKYLVEKGIPSEKIFIDHYGFSTYESIYRAYYTFGIRRMTIVTQDYHLYRALFLAKQFGIEADGVIARKKYYSGESFWSLRELFARDKDAVSSVFKPKPKKDGDTISLDGNGDDTDQR